jgi:hypothetical protein
MDAYPYITDDPLETRPRYDYSEASGDAMLEAWRHARRKTLEYLRHPPHQEAPSRLPDASPLEPLPDWQSTDSLIDGLHASLSQGLALDAANQAPLDLLVQRFEAGKRLYAFLDAEGRSVRDSDYRKLERYVSFGEVLSIAWQCGAHFPYLNALLKIVDLICAYAPTLPPPLRPRVIGLIETEAEIISHLADKEKSLR